MSCIAVLNYNESTKVCTVGEFSDIPELELGTMYECPITALGAHVVQHRLKPLNFSVDRNSAVVQDCGAFSRFNQDGVVIILAELVSRSGVVRGYKVAFYKNYNVGNIRKDALIERAGSVDRPYIHNGILRKGVINCYPMKPFPQIVIANQTTQRGTKVSKKMEESKPVQGKDNFSCEQASEITACKARGINPKLIENPNLSTEQMRVLWVSKKNGAFSEYFAKPEFSVDVMKFYADRLLTKEMVKDCEPMLSRPDLTVGQLQELYQCVCSDIPYEDMLDLSQAEMNLVRLDRDKNMWTNIAPLEGYTDSDLLEKATKSAMKIRGLY